MSMVPPGVARCISWISRSPQNSRPLCPLGPRTSSERRWPLEACAGRGWGARVAGTLQGTFEASISSSIFSSPPSSLVRTIRSKRTSGAPSSVSRARKRSSGCISPGSHCRSSPALQLAPPSSSRFVSRMLPQIMAPCERAALPLHRNLYLRVAVPSSRLRTNRTNRQSLINAT